MFRSLLCLWFAASALAVRPRLSSRSTQATSSKLTSSDAEKLVKKWSDLLANYDQSTARNLFTQDYSVYSASAISLNRNCLQNNLTSHDAPVSEPLFTSRDAYDKARSQQRPITVSNTTWSASTDSSITIGYTLNVTSHDGVAMKGITVLRAAQSSADSSWHVQQSHTEFDTYSWIANLQALDLCINPVIQKGGSSHGAL